MKTVKVYIYFSFKKSRYPKRSHACVSTGLIHHAC